MYNEEQKYMFLNTLESESSKKSLRSMFNRFSKYEAAIECDIASWDPQDIYRMICELHIFDFGTIKQYLSSLTNYRNYVDINTEVLDVQDIDITEPIRHCLIPSPSVLIQKMDKILDPEQGNYMRAVICFAWLGIDVHVMPLLQNTAVDFKAHSIRESQYNIYISDIDDLIIKALEQYHDVREAIRGNGKAYPLYNGRFLRLMVGANSAKVPDPIKVANIHSEFYALKGKYESKFKSPFPLEYANLLRSGGLYRIYHLEKTGVNIFTMQADELLLQTYSAPGKTFDIRSLYRQYKKAFNLE